MTLSERLKRFTPRVQAPPEWGIEPVAREHRVLRFHDYAILWGDLGIGLLVMLTGTFLVPGLGLGSAFLAILIGSALGCLLLASVGAIGSDTGVPTMVLLRPVLGTRGSYIPTALNVLQLLGWTIFEFVVMGVAANAISGKLFGFSSYPLWTILFACIVILMGLGGPLGVVRRWLKRFAVWIALATGVWLTYHLLSSYGLRTLLAKPSDGSLPFWIAVDLVIALPISWMPLVADYNRFARRTVSAFWGTVASFFITNAWFLAIGAMALLGANVKQEPRDFAAAIALTAGWVALLILLADETHNAWADLYSSSVSLQNVFPKVRQRWLIVGLGAACLLVAIALDITQYQSFLFLIGSFFIPLFGILAADYFVVRRRNYHIEELYRRGGEYWRSGGVNVVGIAVWIVGIVVYNVTNPTTLSSFIPQWPKLFPASLTTFGGSLPGFIVSFVCYGVLGSLFRGSVRDAAESGEAR